MVPYRGEQVLFCDEGNWQPLCKPCHDTKTMTEEMYQEFK
ncbi:HNH endonuclease [Desulfotruncus arcticus]